MHQLGKIISWKSDKGFGFIEADKGGPQLFVHITALDRAIGNRPQLSTQQV